MHKKGNFRIIIVVLLSCQAGMTALMMAAENNNERFVDMLLQGGADTEIQDEVSATCSQNIIPSCA